MVFQLVRVMAAGTANKGSVLRIERSSIHDGQGLRTVLFLKGCSLRCQWCSTPESFRSQPEMGFLAARCRGRGVCMESCPEEALSPSADGKSVLIDFSKCTHCFICVQQCPQGAFKKYGSLLSVEEVVQEICKDEIFFFHSGGGLTISGGECLQQADFVATVLKQCRERGIHTAIETSLHIPYGNIEKVLPWLNTLYVDIKHMESTSHKHWVGADNLLILANLKKIDQSGYPLEIYVRIPIIPGVNDSDANLVKTAAFCRSIAKLKEIELLPYHRLGSETYRNLGLTYPLQDLAVPSPERIQERADFLSRQKPGVMIRVGGGFAGGGAEMDV